MTRLYAIEVERTYTNTVFVLADDHDSACDQAKELFDIADADDCQSSAFGDTATPYEIERVAKYTSFWTGGPDGHWSNEWEQFALPPEPTK